MIRITVPALPVRRMKGIGKTSGKPYDLQVLPIYAHTLDANGNPLPYPEKSELMFDADEVLPAPGDYTLSPASLYVDRQGRLAVAPKLVPIKPKSSAV
jgi:hypothetical protein